MKCAIAAVKFSDNLGDGIIFEALSRCLLHLRPGLEISAVDLSGRTSFGGEHTQRRRRSTGVIAKLPKPLRPLLPLVKFGVVDRKRLQQHFRSEIGGSDYLIIGGGHLLADANLNFPTKLAVLASAIRDMRLPVAFYAVGASRWSWAARRLLRGVFSGLDVRWLSVRDVDSQALVRADLSGVKTAPVQATYDPAIACSRFIPAARQATSGRKRIGVNVIGTEWLILDANSDGGARVFDIAAYRDLVNLILSNGHDVALMTNGAEEDHEQLLRITAAVAPQIEEGRVTVIPRAKDPLELIQQVGGLDGLVSHRLHANIVAYSYGVPAIGLEWDKKVPSFFAAVGRAQFCLPPAKQTPEIIADALQAALAMPDETAAKESRIDEILVHLGKMVTSLEGSSSQPGAAQA